MGSNNRDVQSSMLGADGGAVLESIALENSNEGVLIIDRQGKIVFINIAAVILLNCPENKAMGVSISEILFENSSMVSKHDEFIEKVYKEGIDFRQKMGSRAISFKDKKLLINLFLISHKGSKYCACYIKDITLSEQLEKENTELKIRQEGVVSVTDQITLKSSDIRQKIIWCLFGSLIVISLAIQIVETRAGEGKINSTVETIIPGLQAMLGLSLGFYFKTNKEDAED